MQYILEKLLGRYDFDGTTEKITLVFMIRSIGLILLLILLVLVDIFWLFMDGGIIDCFKNSTYEDPFQALVFFVFPVFFTLLTATCYVIVLIASFQDKLDWSDVVQLYLYPTILTHIVFGGLYVFIVEPFELSWLKHLGFWESSLLIGTFGAFFGIVHLPYGFYKSDKMNTVSISRFVSYTMIAAVATCFIAFVSAFISLGVTHLLLNSISSAADTMSSEVQREYGPGLSRGFPYAIMLMIALVLSFAFVLYTAFIVPVRIGISVFRKLYEPILLSVPGCGDLFSDIPKQFKTKKDGTLDAPWEWKNTSKRGIEMYTIKRIWLGSSRIFRYTLSLEPKGETKPEESIVLGDYNTAHEAARMARVHQALLLQR